MLSKNNWLPVVAVIVIAALLLVYAESRLSSLVALDTKIISCESRLGAIELSYSSREAALDLANQKLANRLELAEGRISLLGNRIADLDKTLERFRTKLGSEELTGKPDSIANRIDSLEGGFETVTQAVTTLRQDNTGRAEAADVSQVRILEQLTELRRIQEEGAVASKRVTDIEGDLKQVREESEKTSANLRQAVDTFREELAGAIEQIKKPSPSEAAAAEDEEGLAALTRGSKEEPPKEPPPRLPFEVRASDAATRMVILSRGGKAGIKPGELFSITRSGEHIAFVKVVKVWDDYSGAEVVEVLAGSSVQPRDSVKPVSGDKVPADLKAAKLDPQKEIPPPPPPPPGG